MRLATFTYALIVGTAHCLNGSTVTATFRDIPIALPPLGEPISLKARGTYDIKLVHQWPPLHFDRWVPVEYYEPYGYVYACEDDGEEYIFDSQATRPVIREVVDVLEPAVLYSESPEPIFNFVKPLISEAAYDAGSSYLLDDKSSETELAVPEAGTVSLKTTLASAVLPNGIIPAEFTLLNPGKHLHLRGVVDALTFLPAALFKDAMIQGRAILIGKEHKLFDLERLFGDVFRKDCAHDGLCIDAADTWVSYIAAVQEQALEFDRKIRSAYRDMTTGIEVSDKPEDELKDELILDCGRALIQKIENARLMLMKECENLPNVIDKSRLIQLLVTPLEYLQKELEDKSDNMFKKKMEVGMMGIEMINKHSLKMENAISFTMEQLLRFPKHILHDIRKDIKLSDSIATRRV